MLWSYINCEHLIILTYIVTNRNIVVFITVCIYRYIHTTALYYWPNTTGMPNLTTLNQWFPARVPHNIAQGSARGRAINRKKILSTAKYRGNFCPAVGSSELISECYQLPLSFVLVSSRSMLYSAVLCLCLVLLSSRVTRGGRRRWTIPVTSLFWPV